MSYRVFTVGRGQRKKRADVRGHEPEARFVPKEKPLGKNASQFACVERPCGPDFGDFVHHRKISEVGAVYFCRVARL